MATAPGFFVVSGLPGSGKSTVGAALAAARRLPLLDKDLILEQLFDTLGVGDAAHRSRLSRAADTQLRQQAQQSLGAVIVSWWRHPASVQSTGTETAWLADLPGAWVEVYCRCRPSIAVDRFLARRRHPGHLDRDKTRAAERLRFEQLHALGPLGLGRLITVDTERPVDLPALLRRLG